MQKWWISIVYILFTFSLSFPFFFTYTIIIMNYFPSPPSSPILLNSNSNHEVVDTLAICGSCDKPLSSDWFCSDCHQKCTTCNRFLSENEYCTRCWKRDGGSLVRKNNYHQHHYIHQYYQLLKSTSSTSSSKKSCSSNNSSNYYSFSWKSSNSYCSMLTCTS